MILIQKSTRTSEFENIRKISHTLIHTARCEDSPSIRWRPPSRRLIILIVKIVGCAHLSHIFHSRIAAPPPPRSRLDRCAIRCGGDLAWIEPTDPGRCVDNFSCSTYPPRPSRWGVRPLGRSEDSFPRHLGRRRCQTPRAGCVKFQHFRFSLRSP